MAKAKTLAALAGLAGLAYANRDKLFGSKDKDKGDARPARPESTETRDEEPRRKITDYMKKAPEDEKGSAQSDVLKTVTAPKTASNAQAGNQGVLGGSTSSSKPKPRGMTGAQNDALANAGKKSKATAENNALAKVNRVMDREVTEAAKANAAPAARRANLSPIDQIPGQDRSGPTGGERVSGTELSRNVSNTLSALTPIGGGIGKVGAEMATAGRTQKAYNAAQAERRAAEGMSPAEAIAAKKVAEREAREAKTLNPNAWMACPKGMAENFRSGGAVKMTASRRGDGIASRGKTRGKIC